MADDHDPTAEDAADRASEDDTTGSRFPARGASVFHDEPRGAPSRRALSLVVTPIICLVVATWLGNAFGAALLPDPEAGEPGNPVLLLFLSPQIRWQVAVVNYVDPAVFLTVGTLRLFAANPLFFLLGYWYGDAAVRWMERRSPAAGQFVRQAEPLWRKAAYPLIVISSNNLICLLAGASRIRPVVFVALSLTGTVARLVVIMQFGHLFEGEISSVLGWIGQYRWWIVAASVVIVSVMVSRQLRSGTDDITHLRTLEHDIHADDPAPRDGTDDPADR